MENCSSRLWKPSNVTRNYWSTMVQATLSLANANTRNGSMLEKNHPVLILPSILLVWIQKRKEKISKCMASTLRHLKLVTTNQWADFVFLLGSRKALLFSSIQPIWGSTRRWKHSNYSLGHLIESLLELPRVKETHTLTSESCESSNCSENSQTTHYLNLWFFGYFFEILLNFPFASVCFKSSKGLD